MRKHCHSGLWTNSVGCHASSCECCSKKLHCTQRILHGTSQWQWRSSGKKRNDPTYNVTLTALGDVLGERANLCCSVQRRCNLTVTEGHCDAKAKIERLHAQYLDNAPQCLCHGGITSMSASEAGGEITKDMTQFISKLCDHLDARSSEWWKSGLHLT